MMWSTKVRDLLILSVSGAGIIAACGGSTPPADAPSEAEPAGGEETAPSSTEASAEAVQGEEGEHKSFDAMSPPERMKVMKEVVVPQMTEAFQAFSQEEFGKVNCMTCHGPGAKNGEFEMPSKSLPALDEEEMGAHPEMTKFMSETVVPKMAAILGEEPYNPETHEGFGCFHCHTKKQ